MTNSNALFAAARNSKNHGLTAFAAALLTAFALSAGAFVPRFEARTGDASVASHAAQGATYASAAQPSAKRG
jgi:hypothetical protein